MKKINRRERRESCACTGRGSESTMQRRSIARPSRHLPPPTTRTTRRNNCGHVASYAFGLLRELLLPAVPYASELSQ